METRFGRFISGNVFPKLFLVLYVLFIGGTAYATGHAFELFIGYSWIPKITYGVFALVGILVFKQKSIKERFPNKGFKKVVSFITCFIVYHIFFLICWEIIAVVFNIKENSKAAGVITIFFLAIIIVLLGYLNTKNIKSPSYNIELGHNGSNYRIVLLSDIHLGIFVGDKHVERFVKKINALTPDLVVVSGDIIDVDNEILSDSELLDKISREFRKIQSKEGVFAVLGNHDPSADNKTFFNFMKNSHIQILHNEVLQLSKINLVGRTNAANNVREPFEKLKNRIDYTMPTVVLDHDPSGIKEAAQWGADLVLCGHTHRGQFFPVTWFTKLANGKQFFYGHDIISKTHSIISSGVGFFSLPVRVGTYNEIADIQMNL